MKRERLFDAGEVEKWTGSKALVPLDRDVCPECGGDLSTTTFGERALMRHGGYGAERLTVRVSCPDCGWSLTPEVSEVKP